MESICNSCFKIFTTQRGLSNHLRNGCATNRIAKLTRKCPTCEIILDYDRQSKYNLAIKNNSTCQKCAGIKRRGKKPSIETKEKISERLKEKYKNGELMANVSGAHSKESRIKMGNTKRGGSLTKEHKNKIGEGVMNSEKFKLAMVSEERSTKLSKANTGKIPTQETKNKMSVNHPNVSGSNNSFYNKKHKEETKTILRIKALERRKILVGNNKLVPFYNKRGCDFFNKLMIENNCFIQHAENGGEYHIEELGYWVDGYDKENNIVYEWDEKHHFNHNGTLKMKDITREKQIKEFLNCKVIRFKGF